MATDPFKGRAKARAWPRLICGAAGPSVQGAGLSEGLTHGAGPGPGQGPAHEGINSYSAQEEINSKVNITGLFEA